MCDVYVVAMWKRPRTDVRDSLLSQHRRGSVRALDGSSHFPSCLCDASDQTWEFQSLMSSRDGLSRAKRIWVFDRGLPSYGYCSCAQEAAISARLKYNRMRFNIYTSSAQQLLHCATWMRAGFVCSWNAHTWACVSFSAICHMHASCKPR